MGVLSGLLILLGIFSALMAYAEMGEYDSDEDKRFYTNIMLVSLGLFLTGVVLYPGKTEAEKLYDENQTMKEEIQERDSRMKRWKYIQHLREENKKLKDSLK